MNERLQDLLNDQDDRIAGLGKQLQHILDALHNGEITAQEGAVLIEDVQRYIKLMESSLSLKRRMIITNLITEIMHKIEIGLF